MNTQRRNAVKFSVVMLALLGLVFWFLLSASPTASATSEVECVPQDAWTEYVEHPAVYEDVEHPAVYEDVEHEAVYAVEYQYQKQTKTTVRHGNGNGAPVLVSDWSWWNPASTKWSESDVEVLESGNHANWTDRHGGHTDFFDRDYRYVKNGQTRQGSLISDAWTEHRLVSEAWTETVLVSEAWTETIEHPAVTCPVDQPEKPEPVVTTTTETVPDCDSRVIVTTTTTSTVDFVFDEPSNQWVALPAVVTTASSAVPMTRAQAEQCEGDDPGPNPEPEPEPEPEVTPPPAAPEPPTVVVFDGVTDTPAGELG